MAHVVYMCACLTSKMYSNDCQDSSINLDIVDGENPIVNADELGACFQQWAPETFDPSMVGQVFGFAPPLAVTRAEIDLIVDITKQMVDAVAAEVRTCFNGNAWGRRSFATPCQPSDRINPSAWWSRLSEPLASDRPSASAIRPHPG